MRIYYTFNKNTRKAHINERTFSLNVSVCFFFLLVLTNKVGFYNGIKKDLI